MKKIITIFAVIAMLFTSCTKEKMLSSASTVEMKTVTFTADDFTKTSVDLIGHVSWEENDQISVYYISSDSTAVEVKSTASLLGGKATFSIEIPVTENPDHYYAVYPAGIGKVLPATKDTTEIFNISVTASDGTFRHSNYMAAYTTAASGNFAFKNACGMFRVKLPTNGKITKKGKEYTISGVEIKGQQVSIKSQATSVPVLIKDGAVYDFGEGTGTTARITATNIPDEVLQDGYAYLPSLPGEATKGIYVLYTTREGEPIPAVLTDSNTVVTMQRGHIKPLSVGTDKLIFDYYVSSDGTGDGKSESNPMSFADMVKMFENPGEFVYRQVRLNGLTFHIKGETIVTPETMPFKFSVSTPATISFEGGWQGGKTILDANKKTSFINTAASNLNFSNIVFKNGYIASVGGGVLYCSKGLVKFTDCDFIDNDAGTGVGGALCVNYSGNVECIRCRFDGNKCTGNSGGAVIIASKMQGHAYFTNCIFTNNTAKSQIGLAIHTAGPNTSDIAAKSFIALNNCLLIGNYGTKKAQNTPISLAISHCIMNSSILSTSDNTVHCCIRCGAREDGGGYGGSLLLNNIINNESEAATGFAPYSMTTVNTTYFQRSVGYNQYSACNTDTQVLTNANDNLVGCPSIGTNATINTYTWNKDSYQWAWNASSKTGDMVDAATLESLVTDDTYGGKATAVRTKATAFINWLKGISFNDGADNALTVDLYGTHRDPDAVWPGCYQN